MNSVDQDQSVNPVLSRYKQFTHIIYIHILFYFIYPRRAELPNTTRLNKTKIINPLLRSLSTYVDYHMLMNMYRLIWTYSVRKCQILPNLNWQAQLWFWKSEWCNNWTNYTYNYILYYMKYVTNYLYIYLWSALTRTYFTLSHIPKTCSRRNWTLLGKGIKTIL